MFFQMMSGNTTILHGSQVEEGALLTMGEERFEVAYTTQLFLSEEKPYVFFAGENSRAVILGLAPAFESEEAYVAFLTSQLGDATGFQREYFHGCVCTLGEEPLEEGKTISLLAHQKAGDVPYEFLLMWRPLATDDILLGMEVKTKMPMLLQSTEKGPEVFFPREKGFYR